MENQTKVKDLKNTKVDTDQFKLEALKNEILAENIKICINLEMLFKLYSYRTISSEQFHTGIIQNVKERTDNLKNIDKKYSK